jgi:hypothetical protein
VDNSTPTITGETTLGQAAALLARYGLEITKLHRTLGHFVVALRERGNPRPVVGGGSTLAEALDDALALFDHRKETSK